jgi:hypothetical protein
MLYPLSYEGTRVGGSGSWSTVGRGLPTAGTRPASLSTRVLPIGNSYRGVSVKQYEAVGPIAHGSPSAGAS